MSLNIKNPETHELARELAALLHTTVTSAVTLALKESIATRETGSQALNKVERLRAISARGRRWPIRRARASTLIIADSQNPRIARDAYRDFGKGSGHLAQLNFGDCFSYALAKANTEPLLYVGLDFSHTDVAAARIQ